MEDLFFIDETLYTGRPADLTGRLSKEVRTYDLLDDLHISYERLDHSPTASIEACHDIDKRLGIEICKNLFLCNAQKTSFYPVSYTHLAITLRSSSIKSSARDFLPGLSV